MKKTVIAMAVAGMMVAGGANACWFNCGNDEPSVTDDQFVSQGSTIFGSGETSKQSPEIYTYGVSGAAAANGTFEDGSVWLPVVGDGNVVGTAGLTTGGFYADTGDARHANTSGWFGASQSSAYGNPATIVLPEVSNPNAN